MMMSWTAVVCTRAAYMGIIVFSRHFLQVQQGLVYTFLQLQGTLQSLQTTAPLISIRFLREASIIYDDLNKNNPQMNFKKQKRNMNCYETNFSPDLL